MNLKFFFIFFVALMLGEGLNGSSSLDASRTRISENIQNVLNAEEKYNIAFGEFVNFANDELLPIYSELSHWIEERIIEIKITPLKNGDTKSPQIIQAQIVTDNIVENYKLALDLLTNSKLKLKPYQVAFIYMHLELKQIQKDIFHGSLYSFISSAQKQLLERQKIQYEVPEAKLKNYFKGEIKNLKTFMSNALIQDEKFSEVSEIFLKLFYVILDQPSMTLDEAWMPVLDVKKVTEQFDIYKKLYKKMSANDPEKKDLYESVLKGYDALYRIYPDKPKKNGLCSSG